MTQDVADKKKEITDDDLLALITDEVNQPVTLWSLLDLQVSMPVPKLPSLVMLLSLHQQLLHLGSPAFALIYLMHPVLLILLCKVRSHCSPHSAMGCVHNCMWQVIRWTAFTVKPLWVQWFNATLTSVIQYHLDSSGSMPSLFQ